MSTTAQEEPLNYESVLRLIKHQTDVLAKQSAEFDRRLAEERRLREEMIVSEEQRRKKEAAEFARWKKEMHSQIGGIGKSNGEYAEQFFIRAMKRSKTFGGFEYNQVSSNWNAHNERFDEEYDIILHNGDSLVLIEVKYKFDMDDFTTFIGRKVGHFREFYTVYSDKKLYLGIAGFSFETGVIDRAKKTGIAVLQKDGKNVEYDGTNLKVF